MLAETPGGRGFPKRIAHTFYSYVRSPMSKSVQLINSMNCKTVCQLVEYIYI